MMKMPMRRMKEDRPTKDSEDDYMEEEDDSEEEGCNWKDLRSKLEILSMRIDKIKNPEDPKLATLIKARREISTKLEIRRLKRKLEDLQNGNTDEMYY